MHPGRRNILVRWIGYAVVVIATAAWIYMDEPVAPKPASNVLERLAPKTVDLPSDEVTEIIRSAIDINSKKVATFGEVEKVEPSLIVLDEAILEETGAEGFAQLAVSTIFLGPPDKYAVLGGRVYKEGDVLPDGRTVQSIDADGVDVALGTTMDRLAWRPPFRVELKSVMMKTKPREKDEDEAGVGEAGAGAGAGDEQALPADLSPDQALQILQQVGSQ